METEQNNNQTNDIDNYNDESDSASSKDAADGKGSKYVVSSHYWLRRKHKKTHTKLLQENKKEIQGNELPIKRNNKKEFLSKYLDGYTRSFKCAECAANDLSKYLEKYLRALKCGECSVNHSELRDKFTLACMNIMEYKPICELCFVDDKDNNMENEKLKETMLRGIQKIKCPECGSDVKKHGMKKNYRRSRYKGRALQIYQCENTFLCNHTFVFEGGGSNLLIKTKLFQKTKN